MSLNINQPSSRIPGMSHRHLCCASIVSLALLVLISACGLVAPPPTATATLTPIPPTATATVTPSRTPTPSCTPTPAPLTAIEIFERVSPSIAFVDTPAGTGSGMLTPNRYLITNAHVVWPFNSARLVFADGTEMPDVAVRGWDLLADLAVLGPIDTDLPGLERRDGEDLIIGSEIYLIGYPGEVDEFPVPTISRGLMSRMREWETLGISFFQTDATVAGGQSGGVMVTELGHVIGISGFSFSDADYGLVASASDLESRIQHLIDDPDGPNLLQRRLLTGDGQLEASPLIRNEWEGALFVIDQPVGTSIKLDLDGKYNDGAMSLMNIYGATVAHADNTTQGVEHMTAEIETEAPYFLEVYQYDWTPQLMQLTSSHELIPFDDPDDGSHIDFGDTITGSIDFPGDIDFFKISLENGESVHITVDSMLIDPYLIVSRPGYTEEQLIADDDTGGGLFGQNAELTYQAPSAANYLIVVEDCFAGRTGGYLLSVDRPDDQAPTPMAPEPTPTAIFSKQGFMERFQGLVLPATFEYPETWYPDDNQGLFANTCSVASGCLFGREGMLIVVEEELGSLGQELISLETYVDTVLENTTSAGLITQLTLRETRTTQQGLPAEVIVLQSEDGSLAFARMVVIHDGVAFSISYLVGGDDLEGFMPTIEHSFNSFWIEDLD